MVEKKQMQQTCMTELSELCEKLAKDFNLPIVQDDGKTVLQGCAYRISHEVSDNSEMLIYTDTIADIALYPDFSVRYVLQGRYLTGHRTVLEQTSLGRCIANRIDRDIAEFKWMPEQVNRSKLVTDVASNGSEEIYELIQSHILS